MAKNESKIAHGLETKASQPALMRCRRFRAKWPLFSRESLERLSRSWVLSRTVVTMHSRRAEAAPVTGAGGRAIHAARAASTAHVDRATSCSVRPELATIPHASRIAEAASVGIVGMKVYSVGSETAPATKTL